jgi:hypothetical protein
METQMPVLDRAGALRSLIRFDVPLPGIVRQLMDSLDEDLDGGQQPPVLQVRDMYRQFVRVQQRELSPVDLQEWARVVEGNSEIAVESQRLYPILTELATLELTPDRRAELQLSLTAWNRDTELDAGASGAAWRPRF